MVVIPALFVVGEMVMTQNADLLLLIGKWFVFWGIGIRLLTAGVRQIAQPAFTAKTIFKFDDPGAEKLVTEIGFGNVAMGSIGTLSLLFPGWVLPAAIAGGLYLGLAGLKHVFNRNRNADENTAMITDLIIGAVMIVFVLGTMF